MGLEKRIIQKLQVHIARASDLKQAFLPAVASKHIQPYESDNRQAMTRPIGGVALLGCNQLLYASFTLAYIL